MTVDADGKLSWKPGFDAAGSHSLDVEVSDGDKTDSSQLTLRVANTNRAPKWQALSLGQAQENQNYSAQLSASDADDDALVLTGGFTVDVEDDVPVAQVSTPVVVQVDKDELADGGYQWRWDIVHGDAVGSAGPPCG